MQAPENEPSRPEGRLKSISNWFVKIFSGRDYHYYGYLPSRPNLLLRHTLDRFFARVSVSPRRLLELQQLAEKGYRRLCPEISQPFGFSVF